MNNPAAALCNNVLESLGAIPTATDLAQEVEAEPEEMGEVSNHYTPGTTSAVEERALVLLGAGVQSESVASALGVTPSRIAQLLSNKMFADKVAQLRYKALQEHNARDGKYDSLEDLLITKLERAIPLMVRPDTILKAIGTINGAKRRGQSTPDQVVNQQNIVQIVMPTAVSRKFAIDINNQVTKAGDQELHTMPSGNLLKQVEEAEERRTIEHRVGELLDSKTLEHALEHNPTDVPADTVETGDITNEQEEGDKP